MPLLEANYLDKHAAVNRTAAALLGAGIAVRPAALLHGSRKRAATTGMRLEHAVSRASGGRAEGSVRATVSAATRVGRLPAVLSGALDRAPATVLCGCAGALRRGVLALSSALRRNPARWGNPGWRRLPSQPCQTPAAAA